MEISGNFDLKMKGSSDAGESFWHGSCCWVCSREATEIILSGFLYFLYMSRMELFLLLLKVMKRNAEELERERERNGGREGECSGRRKRHNKLELSGR